MLSKFTAFLESFLFWFIFICALALLITLLSVFLLAWVPPGFILVPAFVGFLWCLFAGTIPILAAGYNRFAQSFEE